jgi:predicted SAM-dependent methyltransferase
VDRILDVRKKLPFTDVNYIVAGHFIEHLSFTDTVRFLKECRRILAEEGVLRVSTPNLDWVHATQYRMDASDDEAIRACFTMNRFFYGWNHQFLYNRAALQAILRHSGFEKVEYCARGESGHETLRGVEIHEINPDSPDLPHLLVVEAWGRSDTPVPAIEDVVFEYRRDVRMPWHGLQYAALWTIRIIKRILRLKAEG